MFHVGDLVKYNGNQHDNMPQYYPEKGTVGVVVVEGERPIVKWPKGSTSKDDMWCAGPHSLIIVKKADCQ